MSLREMIRLYLIEECNVEIPNDEDVERQIDYGIEHYGDVDKLKDSMERYFRLWSNTL